MADDRDRKTSLSRKEDYRDFEERNTDDGWPYADAATAPTAVGNAGYGETPANFDSDDNSGFRLDGIDRDGNENGLRDSRLPDTIDRGESDDLEARVTENIENVREVDMDSIDVHADGHTVTVEGSVETIGIARKVELAVASVDGVRHVRNRLHTTGVDAH
jgi:hypothetical protein